MAFTPPSPPLAYTWAAAIAGWSLRMFLSRIVVAILSPHLWLHAPRPGGGAAGLPRHLGRDRLDEIGVDIVEERLVDDHDRAERREADPHPPEVDRLARLGLAVPLDVGVRDGPAVDADGLGRDERDRGHAVEVAVAHGGDPPVVRSLPLLVEVAELLVEGYPPPDRLHELPDPDRSEEHTSELQSR